MADLLLLFVLSSILVSIIWLGPQRWLLVLCDDGREIAEEMHMKGDQRVRDSGDTVTGGVKIVDR